MNKKYLIPDYISSIERKYRYREPYKDRCWSILSDFVRIRDFLKYGKEISNNKRINNWRETDAGHYLPMGATGAYLGFSQYNIHAEDPIANRSMTDNEYKHNLIKRYGKDYIKALDKYKNKTVKADKYFFIAKIEEIANEFVILLDEHKEFLDYPLYVKRILDNYKKNLHIVHNEDNIISV